METEIERRVKELETWKNSLEQGANLRITKDINIPFNKLIGFIYCGHIASGGTATKIPSGWTSSVGAAGIYTVTHNLNTTDYIVLLTPVESGAGRDITASITTKNLTNFTVDMILSGSDTNKAFFFVLIRT